MKVKSRGTSAEDAKKDRLETLARKIIAKTPGNPFLFPREGRVLGFGGTGPLVLMAFRPSKSSFDPTSASRRILYDAVKANGIEDCPDSSTPLTLTKKPSFQATEQQRRSGCFGQAADIERSKSGVQHVAQKFKKGRGY